MNSGKESFLPVKDFYSRLKDLLRLRVCSGRTGFDKNIRSDIIAKSESHILILGKDEDTACQKLPAGRRRQIFLEKIKMDTRAVIIAEGASVFPELEEAARHYKIAVFCSPLSTRNCRVILDETFPSPNPREKIISGGLLKIYDQGVMITGDSGIGKSESALELLSRGHYFVSDDVVHVSVNDRGRLLGRAPDVIRNTMEIRGLGIINIKEIFGPEKICPESEIDLVILLRKWREGQEFDRLGLKFPEDFSIMGLRIPRIIIPVAPGRNIAALIEVACKVYILGKKGYHAPTELIRKVNQSMSKAKAREKEKNEG